MNLSIMDALTLVVSLIGFVTVWIKIGHNQGKVEVTIERLIEETERNERDIKELKKRTNAIEVRIAEFMGEIKAKFDYIKETIAEIKSKME